MKKTWILTATAAALLVPAAVQAHVTLQPEEAPSGGFTRLDVRVPNERDNKGTTKVSVKMPPGFIFASSEPVPGWKAEIAKRKLAKPVKAFGETYKEEVDTVTFTGDGKTGIIRPDEFQDFGLSVGVPEGKPGSKLTFKAIQTYEGGEAVRWIGAPDADEPAPQVALLEAEEEDGGAGEHEDEAGAATKDNEAKAQPEAASTSASSGDGDDGPSTGLVIAALGLGALGLAAGTVALLQTRRRAA